MIPPIHQNGPGFEPITTVAHRPDIHALPNQPVGWHISHSWIKIASNDSTRSAFLFTIITAAVTILAWGVWIAPMQNVQFKSQQVKTFYVACANLVLTLVVTIIRGYEALPPVAFWLSFTGGAMWSVSSLWAFTASGSIGLARATGIWAPTNIVMGLLWGSLLFHEFPAAGTATTVLLFASAATIIAGILLIIFSRVSEPAGKHPGGKPVYLRGLLAALGAGLLWGTYFIPVKFSGVSPWAASLPMALGILAGSAALVLHSRNPLTLGAPTDYLRTGLGGALWGAGNFSMLLLVGQVGAGRGFTLAQLSLVIGALIGIFWLKDPPPRSRAAAMTFLGCVLAMVGGILLGNL
jgi:glucose uptake protein